MAAVLTDAERQLRHLVGSLIWATAWTLPFFFLIDEPLELDDVVPWGPTVLHNPDGSAQALAIVVALPVIAALPLLFRGPWRWRVSVVAFVLMSAFVLISIIRLGILYLPSAVMLGLASAIRPDTEPPGSRSGESETDR